MPRMSQRMSLWFREEQKAQPPGMTSYGSGGGPAFSDAFRFRRAPSLPALAEAFKSLIYTATKCNADAVARVPLRLFRAGQSKGDTAKFCDARQATNRERLRLKSLAHTSKAMAGAEEVEEITGDHPLLKLVQNVNPSMDQSALIQYTVMSMDVVGTAFWWPDEFAMGTPREFWALPPHLVYPVMLGQGLVPTGYQFGAVEYRPEDLVIFKHLSMKNPYGLGMSPTQAAIEYARLEDTFVSISDDLLSNGPRPSVVISHRDPKGSFGSAERQRLESDMNAKGRGGRSGGAFVVDGAVAVTPISWTPADLGSIEISKYDMERILGCFGVPVSFVTNESSNMAVAREGLEQHARQAVEPRCKTIASVLTRWTHALDRNGSRNWSKLFWAFDDCVPGDAAAEAAKHTAYVAMGLPLNVALTEAGYDAVEGGDVSFVASNLTTLENAVKPPEPPVMPGQKPKPGEEGDDPEAPDDAAKEEAEESKALDAEIADVLASVRTKLAILPDTKMIGGVEHEWDAVLKRYVPCRDASGRFASCGGGGSAKPRDKKPGAGKKPGKKPKEPKPTAPKKPKEPAKPKEPKEPKPKKPPTPKPSESKPAETPKPAKEPKKPAESKPPKEAKPKPEKPKPAEKPPTKYREFTESHDATKQMTDWGNRQSKGWHDSLSPTEAAAVKDYGTNTYGVLNGMLRGKSFSEIKRESSYYIPAGMTAAKAKGLLKETKAAFGKATINEPVVLFRGIKERSGLVPDLDSLKPGAIITEKGFVSTSLDRIIASEFAGPSKIFKSNLVMRIKAPAGTKGAYIDAGGLATFKEAQEVTLNAGTKYRYVGRSKMPGVSGDVDVMDVEIIP